MTGEYQVLEIFECSAGVEHVAEGNTLDVGHEAGLADEPVGLLGCFALGLLLHHDAEDVGEVLVERAGLAFVDEMAVKFGDAVLKWVSYLSTDSLLVSGGYYGDLMPNDIQRLRKPAQDLVVSIPVNHLPNGPRPVGISRISVLLAIMHRANDLHVLPIDRRVSEEFPEELKNVEGVILCLVNSDVSWSILSD
jgi:hypothetical protein